MNKGRKSAEEVFGGKIALQNLDANAKKVHATDNIFMKLWNHFYDKGALIIRRRFKSTDYICGKKAHHTYLMTQSLKLVLWMATLIVLI